jgi:hypothetical protein
MAVSDLDRRLPHTPRALNVASKILYRALRVRSLQPRFRFGSNLYPIYLSRIALLKKVVGCPESE